MFPSCVANYIPVEQTISLSRSRDAEEMENYSCADDETPPFQRLDDFLDPEDSLLFGAESNPIDGCALVVRSAGRTRA